MWQNFPNIISLRWKFATFYDTNSMLKKKASRKLNYFI